MGKTTSAVLLCAAAHARGIDVTLIDSDAQGTAAAWAQAAEEAGDAFPWPIVTAATPANLARALDGHDGLVIVDTPPGGYEVIETAIEVLRVLFLGVFLDVHYFVNRAVTPKLHLNLCRGAVGEALVKSRVIPPIHPFKRCDFQVGGVIE